MIELPEIMQDGDRWLIYGMDPTRTLCDVCREVISEDYLLVSVHAHLGTMIHTRCLPHNLWEHELLGHELQEYDLVGDEGDSYGPT